MKLGFTSAFLLLCLLGKSQINSIGSGNSLHLNGSSDYVDLGNIYDDLGLPVTISAWVYLDPSTTSLAPILATQDNADIYNGVQLFVGPTAVVFEYGDGQGSNSPAFRRGKIATFTNIVTVGRWIHICGVMNGPFDI